MTSMASSMICVGVRSVGLQNGVRWKPISIVLLILDDITGAGEANYT
jgi:hypothetical protein